jgi:hypothetical protein
MPRSESYCIFMSSAETMVLDGNFPRKTPDDSEVLHEHVIVSARGDCYSLAGDLYSTALMKTWERPNGYQSARRFCVV